MDAKKKFLKVIKNDTPVNTQNNKTQNSLTTNTEKVF